MRVTFWGTRGSLASSGPETVRYGGDTACIEVVGRDGRCLVLDAGTGIRRLGAVLPPGLERVDILLTHLHMDHIQGLGFFAPFFRSGTEVHLWGPPSVTEDLRVRLSRYFSPPLFPVRIRDIESRLEFHNAPEVPTMIGGFDVVAAPIIHPGPTVGYRLREGGATIAYLPDHEPALATNGAILDPRWTSGFDLAAGVDLLIHDAQYSSDERRTRIGWGHSSVPEAVAFARLARAGRLAAFHHDPSHDDLTLDQLISEAADGWSDIDVSGAHQGESLEV